MSQNGKIFVEKNRFLSPKSKNMRQQLSKYVTLSSRHPLFLTPIFTNPALLDELKSLVICQRYDGRGPIYATGIPPHVYILLHLKRLETNIKLYRNEAMSAIQQLTDIANSMDGFAQTNDHNALSQTLNALEEIRSLSHARVCPSLLLSSLPGALSQS